MLFLSLNTMENKTEENFTDEEKKAQLLSDFLDIPTTYHVLVLDNKMLPSKLQNKTEIDFTIKPPTMEILAMAGLELAKIKDDIFDVEKAMPFKEAVKYMDNMIRVFCIVSHGKNSKYPDWYEEFLKANCTAKEMYTMFQETAIKSQTGFFLNSLKMLNQSNPMTMDMLEKKGSIRTDS